MHPLTRVGHRLLVSTVGNRDALNANRVTGRIHHDEHVLQTAVFLADQVTGRAAVVTELQHRRRARFDPHLVLDADALYIVARTQTAIVVDQHLGHHE